MFAKKIVVVLFCGVLAAAVFLWRSIEKAGLETVNNTVQKPPTAQPKQITSKDIEPKYDLYSQTPYDIPFSGIMEIAKLPKEVKIKIDSLLERAQGFYFFKKLDDKIFIILQNPVSETSTYSRHDLEIAEISLIPENNYETKIHNIGYIGKDGEIFNAIKEIDNGNDNGTWNFDKTTEPYRPLKHKKMNEKGKVLFTEKWNYSEDSQIKYQMKNAKGKIISILKETFENDSNYRKEHVFYDENGNTQISITINFDGADITRFTYYNSQDEENSVTVINEFIDGHKISEKIYDKNYNLIDSYKMEYENDKRKHLRRLNLQDEEINKISS